MIFKTVTILVIVGACLALPVEEVKDKDVKHEIPVIELAVEKQSNLESSEPIAVEVATPLEKQLIELAAEKQSHLESSEPISEEVPAPLEKQQTDEETDLKTDSSLWRRSYIFNIPFVPQIYPRQYYSPRRNYYEPNYYPNYYAQNYYEPNHHHHHRSSNNYYEHNHHYSPNNYYEHNHHHEPNYHHNNNWNPYW